MPVSPSRRAEAPPRPLRPLAADVPVGRFHAWWRGDPIPQLPHLPGLAIAPADDLHRLASLAHIADREIADRLRRGHRPWLAAVSGEPVGWGWCASAELEIGELGIARPLPPGNRYLWDFFTVPDWRGRGIYPRLLQAIVASEPETDRFWVGHDMPNTPSARGIARAGFREVGILYRLAAGDYLLVPSGAAPRAAAAGTLFGVAVAAARSPRSA